MFLLNFRNSLSGQAVSATAADARAVLAHCSLFSLLHPLPEQPRGCPFKGMSDGSIEPAARISGGLSGHLPRFKKPLIPPERQQ